MRQNSVCAKMAENTGAKHRVLYVPLIKVSKEVYQSLLKGTHYKRGTPFN